MDMEIIDVITTVGFPIAAFLLVYIDLRGLINRNTYAIDELKHAILETRRRK